MTEKVDIFNQLHDGDIFLLPNAWDAVSAQIYAYIGFKAIATSSGALRLSAGMKTERLFLGSDNLKAYTRLSIV